MGCERFYPEEAPVRAAAVDGFWMDRHPVTVRAPEAFVAATGHETLAEPAPEAEDYCLRYRPAARQGETVDTSTSHIGSRCVSRSAGP
jgi:formylglycine-generating enzyme required for sulfatase activity